MIPRWALIALLVLLAIVAAAIVTDSIATIVVINRLNTFCVVHVRLLHLTLEARCPSR